MAARKKSIRKASSTSLPEVYLSNSAEETRAYGSRLAGFLRPGDVVYLSGELGAGKTTLVQGIARGFGIDGFVRSSSFMLVNEYEGRSIKLYHIDLYRLESGQAEGFGLEEYINDRGSVSLIEWADRLTGTTVSPDWEIHLSWQSESTRKIGIHQCRKNRNRP